MDFKPMPGPNQNVTPAPAPAATPAPAAPVAENKGDKVKRPTKSLITWFVVVLLIVALGTAGYYINRYHQSQQQVKKLSSNPVLTAQQEQAQLIAKVGKLTVLPTGETPTIATVTDITKLKDQAFFANAQNGDKVLIYTQAKKAYLYRPSTNKLINIAPVNIGSQTGTTQAPATTPTTSTTVKH
jgi:cell division protein FtsL